MFAIAVLRFNTAILIPLNNILIPLLEIEEHDLQAAGIIRKLKDMLDVIHTKQGKVIFPTNC